MTSRQIQHIESLHGDPNLEIMLDGRTVADYAAEYGHIADLYERICNDLDVPLEDRVD
jgi:hypothetical protein